MSFSEMGLMFTGMGHGKRLAQATEVHIEMNDENPVCAQVDGEPWIQKPSTMVLTRFSKQQTVLCKKYLNIRHLFIVENKIGRAHV